MKSAIHERALSGALASGLSVAAQLLMQILQVPLLLHVWGKEQYGTWVAVFASFSLFSALDLGHQTYVGNILNRLYFESRELFQRTLASSLLVTVIFGVVEILFLGLIVTNKWLGHLFGFEQASWGSGGTGALILIFAAWVCVQNPLFMASRVWVPMGQFSRGQLWGVAYRLAQFSIALAVALLGSSVNGASVGWVVGGLVVCLFMFLDLRRSAGEFYPWWKGASVREGLANWLRSIWMTGNGILDQTSTSGVTLIIGQILGVAALPAFTTVRTLANIATTGTGVVLTPLQVDFVRFRVNREYDKLAQSFAVIWFGLGTFIALVLVVFSPFVGVIYRLWTHGGLSFDYVLYAALGISVAVRGIGAPMANYIVFINHLGAQSWGAVVRAVIVVGGTVILLPRMGLVGAGMAIALAEMAGSFLVPLWCVAAEFRAHGEKFPWRQLGCSLVGLAIAGSCLLVAGARREIAWPFALGGVASISFLAWYQWRGLSDDVRGRIHSLLVRFVPTRRKIIPA